MCQCSRLFTNAIVIKRARGSSYMLVTYNTCKHVCNSQAEDQHVVRRSKHPTVSKYDQTQKTVFGKGHERNKAKRYSQKIGVG